ncbi:thermonuclease family protein [Engelhardtia mirabilis]|uniref:Thermonuclease n=1 Tax=Engelhardtia mirabilis TaxID=2528011 RepID=A0A518BN00_9BACT|nr:Thermonuclease precursor [Planctomycetes bacterium Pla133]QDV02688.1 Thermonuclease precursor [Planctomycetes bacterium Pla86]
MPPTLDAPHDRLSRLAQASGLAAALLAGLLAACASPGPGALHATALQDPAATAAAESAWAPAAPTELFDVVRVVDGDTIHIQRAGQVEKLRLLNVDTEEKLSGRSDVDPLKPETVFGQQCADWAVEFFAEHSLVDGVQRVGLLFPGGVERRDVYGRLLCHVLLPDGTDFNLLLIERGKSPYFNKYGNSLVCDAAMRAAQTRARAARIGIWNPATNRAANEAGPEVLRPYAELLPWWDARAAAVDAYRARAAAVDSAVGAADDPDGLEALRQRATAEVEVFGAIDRIFDEDDGGVTLLLRGDRSRAVRARIAADAVSKFDRDALEHSRESFTQNFLWFRGKLRTDRSGFDMVIEDPAQIHSAGPEPGGA